jgi:mRNA-degrading endonuclease toxin of MazEF toxin-antitoxin module
VTSCRRGGVYQGALKGEERTLLVLSNDEANSVFNHAVVAWVLTDDTGKPLAELGQAVELEGDSPMPGAVCPHLLQTIPMAALMAMRYMGQANYDTISAVEALLLEVLDLT